MIFRPPSKLKVKSNLLMCDYKISHYGNNDEDTFFIKGTRLVYFTARFRMEGILLPYSGRK